MVSNRMHVNTCGPLINVFIILKITHLYNLSKEKLKITPFKIS